MKYIGNKDVYLILRLIRKLTTQFYGQNPPVKRPVRLPTYPTEIILLAAILLKDKLGHSPDFSTTRQ